MFWETGRNAPCTVRSNQIRFTLGGHLTGHLGRFLSFSFWHGKRMIEVEREAFT